MRASLVLVLLATFAPADTVWVKGKKLVGRAFEDGESIRVNEFNSTLPGMTLGTHTYPKSAVKKIKRTFPLPHLEFQRRLSAAESADACFELGEWAGKHKLKGERRFALEAALRFDSAHSAARKALGSKAPKGSWADYLKLAREFVAARGASARLAVWRRIERVKSFPFSKAELLRAVRSRAQPTGYQKDRPLAMRADKLLPNAKYTLLVPKNYDPFVATPLLIGLHGGGAGGADGKLVVGAGHQAMNFYQNDCEERGWICACPNALRAGWGQRVNDDMIDAMLEELCALYNIDENRIYLVGHSMGGGGTWAQGSRLPETWAAIAPAASFGVRGIKKFEKTKTPFYVYHSDNDPRTVVAGVRPHMRNLLGNRKLDFVYTELPGRGHTFPREVVKDIFAFFAPRRLARGPGRFKTAVRPLPSFRRKVSRDEKKYLPKLEDIAGGSSSGKPQSLSALLKELKRGGGVAEASVKKLVACRDDKTNRRVAKVVLDAQTGPDVRRYAARVLGLRHAKDAVGDLGRALLFETDSDALLEMLAALDEINDASAGPPLLKFLKKRADYFAKRRSGKRLHHSDWITILPTLARACRLVGRFKPDHGGAVIAKSVLVGVLLSDTEVVFDIENQRPLPPLHALASAACEAAGRLGGSEVTTALERIVKRGAGAADATVVKIRGPVSALSNFPKDRTVVSAARSALRTVKE